MTAQLKNSRVSVKFTDKEFGYIKMESDRSALSMAEYLRDLVRKDMHDTNLEIDCPTKGEFERLHQKNLKICMATYQLVEKITENFDNLDKKELSTILGKCDQYAKDVLAGEM